MLELLKGTYKFKKSNKTLIIHINYESKTFQIENSKYVKEKTDYNTNAIKFLQESLENNIEEIDTVMKIIPLIKKELPSEAPKESKTELWGFEMSEPTYVYPYLEENEIEHIRARAKDKVSLTSVLKEIKQLHKSSDSNLFKKKLYFKPIRNIFYASIKTT